MFGRALRFLTMKTLVRSTDQRSEMVNLGCGGTHHSAWDNYDYCPASPEVRTIDLRTKLPIKSGSYTIAYSSHTIEHIPRNEIPRLMAEIYRILRPGGIFRIAVPDLEAIARGYILALERCASGVSGAVAEHEWMTIEMLDQMIRCFPGGFMGRLWRSRPLPARSLIEQRVGKEAGKFLDAIDAKIASGDQCLAPDEVFAVLSPDEAQEKTFRKTGEVHRWMYDRFSLARLLSQAGFHDPTVRGALDSRIPEFASYNLDTDENGAVRKPDSLFMEAVKPNV